MKPQQTKGYEVSQESRAVRALRVLRFKQSHDSSKAGQRRYDCRHDYPADWEVWQIREHVLRQLQPLRRAA